MLDLTSHSVFPHRGSLVAEDVLLVPNQIHRIQDKTYIGSSSERRIDLLSEKQSVVYLGSLCTSQRSAFQKDRLEGDNHTSEAVPLQGALAMPRTRVLADTSRTAALLRTEPVRAFMATEKMENNEKLSCLKKCPSKPPRTAVIEQFVSCQQNKGISMI